MLLNWLRHRIAERKRRIFRFSDGHRITAVDPIEIAIGLSEHKTYLPEYLKGAVDGDKESQRIVAQAACDVFGVLPFDNGQGLTVAERIELMVLFDLYLLTVKKNIAASQTPLNSSESTSEPSSETTTSDMSASGATGNDPQRDVPTTSESDS